MKRWFIALAAVCCLAGMAADEVKPVKYVFLFIGDGLSIPQRMMTDEFLRITEGRGLLINEFQDQALTTTRAADAFITDSAASGTAIACGEKTANGRIGMNAAGDQPLASIAEVARDHGRKVGIITNVTINHATPAAFYGHNQSRGNYYQLGLDLVASNFDYFGGGGVANHNQTDDPRYAGDIYQLAEEAGYTVSRTPETFHTLRPGAGKALSFGAAGELPYVIDMAEGDLRLSDFVRQGIELLDNPEGFFIMVEGGKIDWMCHANDATTTLVEVIDFDNAVRTAWEFAERHPDDTLIVVTGDHETGGLTLGFAGTGYASYIELLAAQKASRDAFPGKFQAANVQSFADAKPLLTEYFGFIFADGGQRRPGGLNLTEAEEQALENAYNRGVAALTDEAVRRLNNKASVAWTSTAHTALPVSTTAAGPRSELFTGSIDNTDIAKRLKLVVR